MENLTHYPVLVFATAFILLSAASTAGAWLHRRYPNITDEHKDDLSVILAATLTLLALIIGFSFSMATERYDQRKNFEEAEANAIGTELLRADLLPPDDAARVRKLLGDYLDQRILFYINTDDSERARIDQRTGQLQNELWAAVRGPAAAQQTPVTASVGLSSATATACPSVGPAPRRLTSGAGAFLIAAFKLSNLIAFGRHRIAAAFPKSLKFLIRKTGTTIAILNKRNGATSIP